MQLSRPKEVKSLMIEKTEALPQSLNYVKTAFDTFESF
jgi:hypothetical protein